MQKPRISIISAIAKDRAIGKGNRLLWDIPEDLEHFKKTTLGHPVIMGQKTYESLKGPLPNRANIILTLDKDYEASGCIIAYSMDEAIKVASEKDNNEIFFIGGGQIYAQAIKFADRLYLTIVEGEYEADTYFPDYSDFKRVVSEESHEASSHKFKFLELEK